MATPSAAERLAALHAEAHALALVRVESALRALEDRQQALVAALDRSAAESAGLRAEVAALRADHARHPLRELWTSFLTGDWRAKLAILSPLLLAVFFAYACAIHRDLSAIIVDTLSTVGQCTRKDSHAP